MVGIHLISPWDLSLLGWFRVPTVSHLGIQGVQGRHVQLIDDEPTQGFVEHAAGEVHPEFVADDGRWFMGNLRWCSMGYLNI